MVITSYYRRNERLENPFFIISNSATLICFSLLSQIKQWSFTALSLDLCLCSATWVHGCFKVNGNVDDGPDDNDTVDDGMAGDDAVADDAVADDAVANDVVADGSDSDS